MLLRKWGEHNFFFFPPQLYNEKSITFSQEREAQVNTTQALTKLCEQMYRSTVKSPSPAPLAAALGIQFKAGGEKKEKKARAY